MISENEARAGRCKIVMNDKACHILGLATKTVFTRFWHFSFSKRVRMRDFTSFPSNYTNFKRFFVKNRWFLVRRNDFVPKKAWNCWKITENQQFWPVLIKKKDKKGPYFCQKPFSIFFLFFCNFSQLKFFKFYSHEHWVFCKAHSWRWDCESFEHDAASSDGLVRSRNCRNRRHSSRRHAISNESETYSLENLLNWENLRKLWRNW